MLSSELRYMGYEQTGSVRAYLFERISPGEDRITFIVTADLALFLKHHVRIQEGPALCLYVLSGEADAGGTAMRPPLPRSLADRDLLAHLARAPVSGTKRSKQPPQASAISG
jgi:hypothetical protein